MPEQSNNPFHFLQELKRRKVTRVIPVYAAAAFVLLELVDIIAEPLGLPDWTITLVLVLLCIGFVISVIISWVYDITPEGVQKTKSVSEKVQEKVPEKPSKILGWKIATYASTIIIIGLILFNVLTRKRSVDISSLEKTIAVLPFEYLGLEDTALLHNAIPISIFMELAKIEGFTVRSWRSTTKYKETNLKMPDIGEELKVNFLLTGYILQQDGNLHVDFVLSHAKSEEVIWSDTYEEENNNIIQVRNDISKQVASSLKKNFTPIEEPPADNQDAYMAFLNGLNHYWKDNTEGDLRQAIRFFNKAVELDSNFSQAYSFLSLSNSLMYHFYYDRTPNRLFQAKEAIAKVFKIDPENPNGMFALGTYYYVIHDYEKALEHFKMAEGLVFDDTEFNISVGSLYRRQGKLKKANEYYLKAADADPQNRLIVIELGETYLLLRNYDLAEKYFDQTILMGSLSGKFLIHNIYLYLLWEEGTEKSRQALIEAKSLMGNESSLSLMHHQIRIDLIDKKYEDALITLLQESFDTINNQFFYKSKSLYFAEIYREQNNIDLANVYYDSARIHLEAKVAVSPQDSRYHSSLGIAYAGLGRKKEAIERGLAAVTLMPIEKDFYRGIFRLEDLAKIFTMVGEYGLALEQLDQLLSMPSLISVNLLKKEPVWEPLWELPDFKKLLEKHTDNL